MPQTCENGGAAPALFLEEELFFEGKPEERALYAVFRRCVLARVGEVRIRAAKTQITFAGRYGFAFVSHPKRKKDRGILVSFGLFHRLVSPRVSCAVEPYPNRWTHHVPVQQVQEIDDELLGWIQEAHDFASVK